MPSKSGKQRRYMELCSTPAGRQRARGKCPPQQVAREYRAADRAKARRKKKPYKGLLEQ